MKAEILSVGTELLLGSVLNTNQQFLAAACAGLGIDLYHLSTVGDNPPRLADALHAAFLRSDLVIVTGGLGPTADDVTLETAARALGFKLKTHPPTRRAIQKLLARKGRRLTGVVAGQARVPSGSRVFPNAYGTAPGILKSFSHARGLRHLLLLPGPPREMNPMFERHVRPAFARLAGSKRSAFVTRGLKFSGVPEAEIAARVDDLLKLRPPVTVGIYARPGEVELKIMSKARTPGAARKGVEKIDKEIRKRFPRHVILVDAESLEEKLGALLRKRRKTLAIAESCTGGLAGHLVTNVPGSSDYFEGGITVYQNRMKSKLLGVPRNVLGRFGAVSAETAKVMAEGVRRTFGADLGIGITGIAGPSGGTAKKPVGTVFIGVADGKTVFVRKFFFIGKREDVKLKAARSALLLLVQFLSGRLEPKPPNRLENQVRI